jgi:hypothetical protein
MTRALVAAGLALALAGSALAAIARGDTAREPPADAIVTCAACHDASFVVLPR